MTEPAMRRNRRHTIIAGLAAAAVTACSPGPVPAEQPNLAASLWDPCTEIPDLVLVELGVDPATEIGSSRETPEIRLCQWTSSRAVWWQILEVTATTIPFDTVKQINTDTGYTEIAITDRPAIRISPERSTEQGRCDITSATPQGTVTVSITLNSADDPCPAAEAATASLDALIPK